MGWTVLLSKMSSVNSAKLFDTLKGDAMVPHKHGYFNAKPAPYFPTYPRDWTSWRSWIDPEVGVIDTFVTSSVERIYSQDFRFL